MSLLLQQFARYFGVRRHERAAVSWSFAWFFCILFAYNIIRPIRETLAASTARDQMTSLFLTVCLVMLLAVPAYAYFVARFNRRRFVAIVFRFFATWLLLFSWWAQRSAEPSYWLGATYFVWVSVFNLFVVSVFWSVLADSFNSAAGKRLFGLIASGGSLGGLCGSLFVERMVTSIQLPVLLLVAATVLELSLVCFRQLDTLTRRWARDAENDAGEPADEKESTETGVGGGLFEGMHRAFSSRYLFGICLFLLLGKFCATTVYLKELEIVQREITSQEAKAALFAKENFVVNIYTLLFQAAFTSVIIRNYGLPAALALLPVAMLAALFYLAGTPTLAGVMGIQVIQRSLTYGLVEPAKSILFTVVSREDKYKTKSFIDTFIFRGGDVLAAGLEKTLSNATSFMIPVTFAWCLVSWKLGIRQRQLAASHEPSLAPSS